jgi:hypothetical protein
VGGASDPVLALGHGMFMGKATGTRKSAQVHGLNARRWGQSMWAGINAQIKGEVQI